MDLLYFIIKRMVIVRIVVLFFTLYLTWFSLNACIDLAVNSTDHIGTAALIAAIMAPISVLLGFVMKLYNEARRDDT